MTSYGVILADPPWSYSNNKTGGERNNKDGAKGGCLKHYDTMTDDELFQLAGFIDSLASENCALFMWPRCPA